MSMPNTGSFHGKLTKRSNSTRRLANHPSPAGVALPVGALARHSSAAAAAMVGSGLSRRILAASTSARSSASISAIHLRSADAISRLATTSPRFGDHWTRAVK
jgi:hypothetical protein